MATFILFGPFFCHSFFCFFDYFFDTIFSLFFQSTTTQSESNYEDGLGADLNNEEHAKYATTRSQHQQGLDLFLVGLWTSRTENIA